MGMNLNEGDRVQIAQNGLPRHPVFEYDVAEVYESDIDIRPGVFQRMQLQSPRRRRRAHSLIDHVLGVSRSGSGPLVEVVSHSDPQKHDRATYYHVYFDNGQGIYPEDCLVPMPEDSLEENKEGR